jgi:cytochrome c biogenesis protein CcdA
MNELPLWPAATAVWRGLLTSISPCPLATNIAAVAYIGRQVASPARAIFTGLAYTLGRALTYTAIAALLVGSLVSAPTLSFALQGWMNRLLGPLLIVVGLILLGWLPLPAWGGGLATRLAGRLAHQGVWGGAALGMVFAISFCPVSAALFFASLIPLAVSHHDPVVLPTLYGVGTALPVALFAVLVAVGAGSIGRLFARLTAMEVWLRRATATLFIATGVYFALVHIYGVGT